MTETGKAVALIRVARPVVQEEHDDQDGQQAP